MFVVCLLVQCARTVWCARPRILHMWQPCCTAHCQLGSEPCSPPFPALALHVCAPLVAKSGSPVLPALQVAQATRTLQRGIAPRTASVQAGRRPVTWPALAACVYARPLPRARGGEWCLWEGGAGLLTEQRCARGTAANCFWSSFKRAHLPPLVRTLPPATHHPAGLTAVARHHSPSFLRQVPHPNRTGSGRAVRAQRVRHDVHQLYALVGVSCTWGARVRGRH